MSLWWPESRRHTKDPQSEIRITPAGRFWERSRDGREVELGVVREWDAPNRLLFDFFVGTDAQHPTEVVVTFTSEGEGTRVSIDHRPKPVSREVWGLRAPRFVESWDAVLAALSKADAAALS